MKFTVAFIKRNSVAFINLSSVAFVSLQFEFRIAR